MNIPMTSEVFNMIWTAGFQSGMNIADEIIQEKTPREGPTFDKRVAEMLNADADGIEELWKLKKQMGESQ